jgi:hypothetical protein
MAATSVVFALFMVGLAILAGTEEAIVLGSISPGDCRISSSRRLPPAQGPGRVVKFTICTRR